MKYFTHQIYFLLDVYILQAMATLRYNAVHKDYKLVLGLNVHFMKSATH